MFNMRKLWIRFIEKPIVYQTIAFSMLMAITTLIFIIASGLISIHNENTTTSLLAIGYTNLVINDVNDLYGQHQLTSSIKMHLLIILSLMHKFIMIFLLAIWQAVLIFKMLLTKPSVHVSKILCYYNAARRLSEQDHNSLVFRLANLGSEDLYKVNISAQLRILIEESPGNDKTTTFRYYDLEVTSPNIPVLEPNMPYLIFIKTGLVKNVGRKAFLITDEHDDEINTSAPIFKIENFNNTGDTLKIDLRSQNNSASIIVLIEVFDDLLDQNDITKVSWKLSNPEILINKKFKSIEPKVVNGSILFEESIVKTDIHKTA